jgi:rare lipoprotein A
MRAGWTTGLTLVALAGCAAPAQQASIPAEPCMQIGLASWYRPATNALTAAHTSLPFGTMLLVTDLATGRSVLVRVSDRGPFRRGRVIDLSAAAAESLGIQRDGIAKVRLEIFLPPGSATSSGRCPFGKITES